MSIIVESLAVKYRPKSILDLVGQDSVVSQIRGMVKSKRFPAALLIVGDSGCGKTTTSRIIARTVNCKNLDLKTLTPCGECQSCRLGEASPDYTEMNIGDTRGIDDIRSICQASRALPVVGNNRVIVLDEVHMLTVQAANALLKTLEEPPPRTLWVLATTNPEKLLGTIVGRCTKLNLTTIEPDVVSKRLRLISKREGVDLKEFDGGSDIVKTIVDLSNGRMRDAISILESALFAIKSNKNVDAKAVLSNFLNSGEADLEKTASLILLSVVQADLKGLVHAVRTTSNARGVLQKLRWIIQYLLDNSVGLAKYTPYGARLFSAEAKKKQVSLKLDLLIRLQYALMELEERFNRMSIDETVMMLSTLGQFLLDNKK